MFCTRLLLHSPLALVFTLAALTSAFAQTAKPVINKIDPPNWFIPLPDSLLLIHGEHLENTTFQTQGTKAHLRLRSISANGHWAFLTLASKDAKPGTLTIVAKNRFGTASAPYILTPRRSIAEQPKGFNADDVLYLVMPDRFANGDSANDTPPGFRDPADRTQGFKYHGGDLRGIEQHLDYLQKLGVTTIWTTPLYDNSAEQSGNSYHGYSATDMYAVDPHFGNLADYRALSAAAHARGMKIVLDTVPNHVGAANPWANDPPTPTWLHGSPAEHLKCEGEFTTITNPAATAPARDLLLNGWFANLLPDLDQDDPLVAEYLTQNAIWWIESAGLDGLRIDTFPYVPRSFWHGYNQRLHALYPHLSDVGEIFNPDPKITSFFAGGRANTGSDGTYDTLLDTPFDFPVYFALRKTLTHHAPMSALADVLAQDTLYPHPERLVTFFANHDVTRFLSEPGASIPALHLAYGLLATLRGMPEIYYGDEIEMTGGKDDPSNRRDFPGGFSSDPANAFTAPGRTPDQQAMQAWVTSVFELRARTSALRTGEQKTLLADGKTIAYLRGAKLEGPCKAGEDRVLIVVNNDQAAQDIAVASSQNPLTGCHSFTPLLASSSAPEDTSGSIHVHLPAQEIGIYLVQP